MCLAQGHNAVTPVRLEPAACCSCFATRGRVIKSSAIYSFALYCKFGNFRENFIFANSVKRHICDEKSRTGHDIPISVKDRVISPIREGLIFTKLRK